MRQRNARAEALILPDLGVTVPPGGEIDPPGDEVLAGFEPVTEPRADPPATTKKSADQPSTAGTAGQGEGAGK